VNSYLYRAIDSEGKLIQGVLDVDDIAEVRTVIAGMGLFFLDMRHEPQTRSAVRKFMGKRTMPRKDVIELSTNLSVMLKAGMPISTALADIVKLTENRRLRFAVSDIRRRTEQGMRFSETFIPHNFPNVFVKVIQVGEETGRLDQSLAHIADHLQKMEDLSAAIMRALIYPSFAIVATLGSLVFWLVFVLPGVMATMKDLGAKIPPLTRGLMHFSNFSRHYWYTAFIAGALIYAALRILKSRPDGRLWLDKMKITLPVIKLIVYNKLHAVFSEQLRILLVAGMTITKSLDMMSGLVGNEVFRRAIIDAKERIATGSTISNALREQNLFSPILIRMVDIGEKSGTLDEQFGFLSEYYIKKLDDISDKLGKIIEPLVISVLGAFFAIIIGGLLLPIYDLVAKVGKG
jgi:type II secretory pathway component PulF